MNDLKIQEICERELGPLLQYFAATGQGLTIITPGGPRDASSCITFWNKKLEKWCHEDIKLYELEDAKDECNKSFMLKVHDGFLIQTDAYEKLKEVCKKICPTDKQSPEKARPLIRR